jgi:hypothetical protein
MRETHVPSNTYTQTWFLGFFRGFFRGFSVSFAVSFLGPSAMECVGLAPEAPTAAPPVCPVKPVPVWRHWGIGLGKEVLPPRSTVVPPAST